MSDVTERRRGEDALRESHERTAAALSAAAVGVWEIDLDSHRMTWSENVARLFGRAPEAFPSGVFESLELVHPDDVEQARAVITRAIHDRVGFDTSFRVLVGESERRLHVVGRVLHDETGRGVRLVGVTTDVTENHLLEAQLRQAQKMEAVGQLAGGVAHDFNNMLTAILGYCRFLEDSVESETQRADVHEIMKAADRATGLTRQLLAFSRSQVFETVVLDLNSVVAEVARMLQRLVGEDVSLETSLIADPALVRSDRGQIEQVLMNLVVNARDAMPDGGLIRIETANVSAAEITLAALADSSATDYVCIRVRDSGTGMSEETKRRMFEPFFTTKERGRGTGLGLATAYGIVRQSSGDIAVESTLGKGTTFHIYLPLSGEALESDRHVVRSETAVRTGGEGVLLVEDEEPLRHLLQVVLERGGYKVAVAANPSEAEAVFARVGDGISVVVADVIMPGGRGPDLVDRLLERNPSLRVVFISGYTDRGIDQGMLKPGQRFLQKPFVPAALLQRIRDVLEA